MARTNLPKTVLSGPYAVAPAALTWTAADVANGNSFVLTGNEVLLVRNVDTAAAHNVTMQPAPDAEGRTGTAQAQSLGAASAGSSTTWATQRIPLNGWLQSDGTFWVNGDNVNIQFAVLQLPA